MNVPVARLFCASLLLAAASFAARAAEPVSEVRLYAIDCGHISIKNAAPFSDSGDYDGKSLDAVVSCYLIRHPKGALLWDLGLNDEIAKSPQGVEVGGNFHMTVKTPLIDQLAQVGLKPADVNYIAFSHLHFDHTGNANAFGQSTWLMNKAELAAAVSDSPPFGVDPALISAHKTAKIESFSGDHDVFGDGKVMILTAPGHTPGHQVLQIQLAQAGTVVLSGDLYHTHENRKERNVPAFNTSRADTLASFDRVEKLVKNRKARFVVQHVPEDVAALPKFPAFLK
jgi:N-acyl homoserine lactone hydrolase